MCLQPAAVHHRPHALHQTSRVANQGTAMLPLQLELKRKEAASLVAPYSASYNRTLISTILQAEDGGVFAVHAPAEMSWLASRPTTFISSKPPAHAAACMRQVGRTLRVGGWVKTGREAGGGAWVFLEINDGSCFHTLQVGPPSSTGRPCNH